MVSGQGQAISHRFRAIADSRGRRGKSSMRIRRGLSVFVPYLQLIVEKYGIFPKRRSAGRIDICKKTALQFASCLGIQPSGLGFLYDNCSEKSVDICTLFAASCIAHVVKQVYALPPGVPGVDDFTAGRGVFIKSCAGPIRCLYIIIHTQNMDGKGTVQ